MIGLHFIPWSCPFWKLTFSKDTMLRFFIFVLLVTGSCSLIVAEEVSFDRDIRPILSENCFACHGFDAKSREADLRLDTRQGAVDDSGSIVPGDSSASALVDRLHTEEADERMPPPETGHVLTSVEIKKIETWINQGAEYETHWSFVAPKQVPLPKWNSNSHSHAIDQFIGAKLAELNLNPSEQAEPRTLMRRVSLDLIGLPPTLSEIESFEKDAEVNFDGAYDSLVERLLASPHYGERWGRWWLDQARYADSNGYSVDAPREIWQYRDWVVHALNEDMPFDQFTIEQLAGDLVPGSTDSQKIATGFHRNTSINQEGGIDHEQFRIDSIFDRVGTTGTVWLGLTIGCSQCHDHKFDPLTQKEFYQLFAFLNNQDEPTLKLYPEDVDATALIAEQKEIHEKQKKLIEEHADSIAKWEAKLDEPSKKALAKEVFKAIQTNKNKRSLSQQLAIASASGLLPEGIPLTEWASRDSAIAGQLSRGVSTMVLSERSKPRTTTVFIKGDFTRPDQVVTPGTPAVLHPLKSDSEYPTRLDLARWIVSPENPLTSRVIANRIWQQYFGRGLVETDSDFGLQGTSPTHPELLDWLALNLQKSGWSLKSFHRMIVTSKTYRQSSKVRSDLDKHDPLNLLLGRQNRLRLDAEIVRDVALVASGLFSPKLGGPPVYPPIPDGVMSLGQVRRGWSESQGDDRYRRGLYTFIYRVTPPPSLNVFDAPDGLSSCTRRIRSNTPLQALTLLNDRAFFEFAEAMQKRIEVEGIASAFQRCTTRSATEEELKLLSQLDTLGAARALLNLDETINRE